MPGPRGLLRIPVPPTGGASGIGRATCLRLPADFPGVIAFLLPDDAGFITGQTTRVSGGLTHG